MINKKKIILGVITFIFIIACGVWFLIIKDIYFAAFQFFAIGFFMASLLNIFVQQKGYKQSAVHITGTCRHETNTMAAGYMIHGLKITAIYCTRKYFIFGKYIYHVKLDYPKSEKENKELSDDELLSMERYEELAERHKKNK